MKTTTFYRKANISSYEATASIAKSFPKAELVSFVKKAATAEEAKMANVKTGAQIYAATVRVADFPPADDKPGAGGPPADDAGDDSSSEDEGGDAPDFTKDEGSDEGDSEGGEGEGGEKPKKLSPPEETNKLLQQLIDIVGGGGGSLGPDAGLDGPDAGGPGLPDVGAPGAGEMGGGLPGGPGGGAPLPPPIKPKAPMGGGAFAHYDPSQPVFSTIRVDAGKLTTAEIRRQAEEVYPTHQVAKIQRTGTAKLGRVGEKADKVYDLAKNKVAVITLVAK